MTAGERLELLYNTLKSQNVVKNKKDFSQKIGIDDSLFNKYCKNIIEFKIGSKGIEKFLNLNININWLLTGKDEMFLQEANETNNYIKICKLIGNLNNSDIKLLEAVQAAKLTGKQYENLFSLVDYFLNNAKDEDITLKLNTRKIEENEDFDI